MAKRRQRNEAMAKGAALAEAAAKILASFPLYLLLPQAYVITDL